MVNDAKKQTYTMKLDAVSQTGTYTAYNAGSKTYRFIVPPCTLKKDATFWLRDGEKRYSMALSKVLSPLTFEAGKLYNIKMTIK